MKMVLLYALLLTGLSGYSQGKFTEWSNWKIDTNKKLIWQLVVEDSTINVKDTENHLRTYSWCKDVHATDLVAARGDDYLIDFRRHKGHSGLPVIYKTGKWDFTVRYEWKAGKYRITVESVSFDAGEANGGFYDIPIVGPYDDVVLKKSRDEFRGSQLEYLTIFSAELKRILLVTKKTTSADW
jgi:hypothetical protein